MTDTVNKFQRVMHELRPRPVTVSAIDDLTPRYRRMTFSGAELNDFVSLAPTDHIKVQIDVDGEPVRRDYTPRAYGDGTLTVEFALHAEGPLTSWARAAQIGAEATILGPRGSKVVHPVFDTYLIVGDDTMLPAVGRAMELVPEDARVIAVIEIDRAEDKIELPHHPNGNVVWAKGAGGVPGAALVEALRALEWPEGELWVWAGGEAGAMRDVRRFVLNERDLPREHLSISGHWKRGESDFDHHSRIEE